MEQFPLHVVCGWLGNSTAVALGHDLIARDEHFALAIAGTGGVEDRAPGPGDDGAGAEQRNAGQRAADGANVATAVSGGAEQAAA